MNIAVYGSRGSMPFFSRESVRFGGNSLCIRLGIKDHTVILDCGSGLNQFAAEITKGKQESLKFDILLGHLHLDHIIGLSAFEPILSDENEIRIFTKSRNDKPLSSQIFGIFKPPYWPVEIEKLNKAQIVEINCGETFPLNDFISVKTFEAEHPDGTTSFRLEADKSVVYLSDYEVNEKSEKYNSLVNFCKNADIIFFDAAYLPEDYNGKQGWGHSTYEHGYRLAEASSCRHMVFTHLSTKYTDETLSALSSKISKAGKIRYSIASDGMEIEL